MTAPHGTNSEIQSVLRGRRYPVGVELLEGVASFRVWAPSHQTVSVVLADGTEYPMEREGSGHFRLELAAVETGTLYQYRLGDLVMLAPDPASRFQPNGPAGWSMIVDPTRYRW